MKSKIAGKSRLNTDWHRKHPIPANPSLDQRITWHLEHAPHCACRKISEQLKKEMEKRGIKIPS